MTELPKYEEMPMLEKWLKGICGAAMVILLIGCGISVWSSLSAELAAARDLGEFEGIPQLHLDGNMDIMWVKEDVREVSAEYRDENGVIRAYAKLNIQGASSVDYDKKNYTVKFYRDEDCSDKKKIDFGWGPQSKYCLKANWVDRTHARNIISARLAAEVQEKYDVLPQTPNHGLVDGFPIELYNNGKFLGLYTLNIPKDEWLLAMDKDNPNHLAFISYNWNPSPMFEEEPSYTDWGIEVGEQNRKNLDTFSRLFRFVMEASDREFREQQPDYFDLDAALNYIILCEFGLMVDNSVKNMVFATYDAQVWYPSLYDMDSSWGSDWSGTELYPYTYASITSTSQFLKRVKEVFAQELVERYFELREDILTKEHVMALFEDFRAGIPAQTWEKEQQRWKHIPGYDYGQIEDFLDERIPWLDGNMRELLDGE
ncbi:MAG: CotH kinase family protein [Eubacteriales bacterium]|nr:CotH kinase family protein [Eubacteriales bacterium]